MSVDSNDSFCWMNASTDSNHSEDSMKIPIKMDNKQLETNVKENNRSRYDSEINESVLSDPESGNVKERKKKKKKKSKHKDEYDIDAFNETELTTESTELNDVNNISDIVSKKENNRSRYDSEINESVLSDPDSGNDKEIKKKEKKSKHKDEHDIDAFNETELTTESTELNDVNNISDVVSKKKKKSKKRSHSDYHTDNSVSEETLLDIKPAIDISPIKHKDRSIVSSTLLYNDEQNEIEKRQIVKVEPDSDIEKIKKKKKKSKNKEQEDNIANGEDYTIEDSITESPVKKKKSKSNSIDTNYSTDEYNGLFKKPIVKTEPDSDNDKIKKKMKKSKKADDEDFVIEDKFSAEETIVEQRDTRKDSVNSVSETTVPDKTVYFNNLSEIKTHSKDRLISGSVSNPVGTMRISERLQFEDDEDQDMESNEGSVAQEDQPHQVRHFLEHNTHLKPYKPSVCTASTIGDNDDTWLIRCPRDVDITKLENTTLLLDTKCKMKIDGHTYNGTLINENNRTAVITVHKNKWVIKNMTNGEFHFRKRLPKVRVAEDNMLVNCQTNFIPLPDTKCRHPLFGTDYQKFVNAPLRAGAASLEHVKSDRKKKKREKCERDEIDAPEPSLQKTEKKKNRKRKHSQSEEAVPAKSKKVKYPDPDSWESEKAIEENLFDF